MAMFEGKSAGAAKLKLQISATPDPEGEMQRVRYCERFMRGNVVFMVAQRVVHATYLSIYTLAYTLCTCILLNSQTHNKASHSYKYKPRYRQALGLRHS
jgi:hypothetical protein